ncbi:MAG: plasmid pRiA4b ORF-3 family protein [Cyanobacteria bacterium CAN_BIN43]|nr:plasmid pRiA4b ORF-3 family protein [Cyanobacteria bacterium CAN_BIN43]
MAKTKKSEDVPKAMKEKFDRVVAITDAFSKQLLNDEYAQLIRFATAALCRKRPSPLASGTDKTWACGVSHALGMINFLFDSSQDPHVSSKDLYQWFGVSASTGQAKSKLVRDTLRMHQMDPDWCLPSLLDRNPMAWMITVNGLIFDARSASRPIQEMAYAKGLIPYIPGDRPSEDGAKSQESTGEKSQSDRPKAVTPSSPDALYVLDVFLVSGPVSDQFIAKNPEISRTIEIKGSNTLEDLHNIIFEAFDREEAHMYEFQVGGRGPQDPNARRYGLKQAFSDSLFEDEPGEDVASTAIASIGFSVDESFGYWFDFGDDWWHQINVVAIAGKASKGQYPKITKRVGASPPQYADF